LLRFDLRLPGKMIVRFPGPPGDSSAQKTTQG